jgi:hypothetical protein
VSRASVLSITVGLCLILLVIPQVSSHRSASTRFDLGATASASVRPAAEYSLTFTESGLPTGTNWSVDLGSLVGNSSGDTVSFEVANGTFAFSIPAVQSPTGAEMGWASAPGSGSISVTGNPVGVSLIFGPTPVYSLEFEESGGPANQSWSVTIGTETLTNSIYAHCPTCALMGSVTFAEPAGVLSFAISPPPHYGVVKVSRLLPCAGTLLSSSSIDLTQNCDLRVTFGEDLLYVFSQAPIPRYELFPGAIWSVTLLPAQLVGGPAEEFNASSGSSIGFLLPQGAVYKFVVTGPGAEYRASPAKGEIRVANSPGPQQLTVKFKLLTSNVIFIESGLVRGASWNLTILAGTSPAVSYPVSEQGPGPIQLSFHLPAGTYVWLASAPGTSLAPVSGEVQVNQPSRATHVAVPFSQSAGAAGCFFFTTNGAPVGTVECNANANDILVNFTELPGAVCANQFELGGASDGPSQVCPMGANQLEVNWTASAMGPVIPFCYWAVSGVVIGTCPVPSPEPNGFVLYLAEISSVDWTVNGVVVGSPIPAPAVANGVEFYL